MSGASWHDFGRLARRFPDPWKAPADGLLAYGGDLEPQTLLAAYSRGIFPWFSDGQPILWWSPDPRCVLLPADFHIPARSARKIRNQPFSLTMDACFSRVMRLCASPRGKDGGTWITPSMLKAYETLHELGYAHSIEAWRNGRLAGGLYGVAMGRAFFGESMFHLEPEASRAALAGLVSLLRKLDVALVDCQQETPHMLAMGARMVSRNAFLRLLQNSLRQTSTTATDRGQPCPWSPWKTRFIWSGQGWAATGQFNAVPLTVSCSQAHNMLSS